MKRILLTEFFTFSNASRNDEIRFVLDKNVKSGLFDEIVLLSEKDQGPLSTVITGKRITYKYAFEYANENFEPGTLIVISNADIYFDESLRSLSLDANTCVALTRYNDGVLDPGLSCTQDSWMFSVPIKIPPKCDFYFGIMGCDNYIARLLKDEGYRVMNPALDVKSHHVHTTQYRTYVPKPIKPREFYHFVDPCTLRGEEPSSFCTISNDPVALVCSIHRWHKGKPVYVATKESIPLYFGAKIIRKDTTPEMLVKAVLAVEKDTMFIEPGVILMDTLYIDKSFKSGKGPLVKWFNTSGDSEFTFHENYGIDESFDRNQFDINGARYKCRSIKCLRVSPDQFILSLLASSNRWIEILLIERALMRKWVIGKAFDHFQASDVIHVPGSRLGQFVSLEKDDERCLKIVSRVYHDEDTRFHQVNTKTDWVTFLDALLRS